MAFSKTNQPLKRGVTKPGFAHVGDEGTKRAQASLMLAQKIQGASVAQIGKNFNVSNQTVKRRIDYAQRHNLLSDATDRVLNELVGLAHQVYIDALMAGDVNAARDVMFGTGILSRGNKAQVAPAVETMEMTLEVWRDQRKKGYETANTSGDTSEIARPVASRDAEIISEVVDEGDDGDDLPAERPSEWPIITPDSSPLEGDEEDQ